MLEDLALHHGLRGALAALKLVQPTDVQAQVIPEALTGRDLLVSAKTGSGKTLAYLIPSAQRILSEQQAASAGTLVLILVPTRELARQVEKHFAQLGKNTGLRAGVIIGGNDFKYQKSILRKNPEFIIATPGRLIELLKVGSVDLKALQTLVIDEADHMLDMGFRADVLSIVEACAPERQTLLLSATLRHSGVTRIASEILVDAIQITVGSERSRHVHIHQQVILSDDKSHREKLLVHLLKSNGDVDKGRVGKATAPQSEVVPAEASQSEVVPTETPQPEVVPAEVGAVDPAPEIGGEGNSPWANTKVRVRPRQVTSESTKVLAVRPEQERAEPAKHEQLQPQQGEAVALSPVPEQTRKTLVFTNKRITADQLSALLRYHKFRAGVLHGELSQEERNFMVSQFAEGKISVLVASDVAARGLDVKDIDTVINFDFPRGVDDYIHRIGRTGRAGRQGLAISFVSANDWNLMAAIERYTETAFERRTVKSLKAKFSGPKKLKSNGKAAGKKKKIKAGDKSASRHRNTKNKGKRKSKGSAGQSPANDGLSPLMKKPPGK
ncbi:MAG: DEAD/DEAH box helicase [Porticoccaceae bacterium]|nr:DEAD/DEAH box helicase [Porticoccaceae bacterium]